MPNWVPQSPTWLRRSTGWPRNSSTRASESPMIVERRCPTCISLAMLGLEKSTITGRGSPATSASPAASAAVGTPRRGSPRRAASSAASRSGRIVRLMKPGPAIWGSRQRRPNSWSAASCSTIAVAMSRGLRPRGLARGRAPLAWKSPNSGLLAGTSWGSRGAPAWRARAAASGKERSIAARSWASRVWARRSMGGASTGEPRSGTAVIIPLGGRAAGRWGAQAASPSSCSMPATTTSATSWMR